MEKKSTLTEEYFKKVYEAKHDPWNFATSAYEKKKYAATIKALPKKNYNNALEIGCSIGVLTKLLSKKCTQLLATDISDKALEQARERCKNMDHITFQKLNFPTELPNEKFDLIMVSEVAYYLSTDDWKTAIHKIYGMLLPKGQIALIHWLPEVHDYPQTGDEVHDIFSDLMNSKMKNIFNSREEKYRIDIWEKTCD